MVPNRGRLRRVPPGGVWAIAAVLVSLAFAAVFRSVANKPETLLAAAYTAHRSFVFRLPDKGYSPLASLRKGAHTADDDRLKVSEAIHATDALLARDGADPQALGLKARGMLLEGNYTGALVLLEPLHRQAPGDGDHALSLGVAYALRAENESGNRASDLTRALDLLLALRKTHPGQPEVLFNIPLVWERIPNPEAAAVAWCQFLRADSNSGFANEARDHLGEMEKRLAERKKATAAVSAEPRAFLELQEIPAPDLYLETALANWLPRSGSGDAQARSALHKLAQLHNERSGDPFLEEIIQQPHPALAELSRAVRLNRSAGPDEGLLAAERASQELSRAGLRAGALRARSEYVYGLHRATRVADCIAAAESLAGSLKATPYAWMKAHNLTEEAICLAQAGEFSQALETIARANELASRTHLRMAELRANGMQADFLQATGNRRVANQRFSELLDTYWKEASPPNHAHQIFFHWRDLATSLGLKYVAAEFATAGAMAISTTDETVLSALAWDTAAAMSAAVGDGETETLARGKSRALFEITEKGKAGRVLAAAASLHAADAWLKSTRTGGPTEWIRKLEDISPESLTTMADRNNWYETLGVLYFLAGDEEKAEQAARTVIARASAVAATFTDKRRQTQALAAVREARGVLAELRLTRDHDPEAALAAWQPEHLKIRPMPAGVVYLTLLPLPGGLVLFAQEGAQLRHYRLSLQPQRERELAFRLLRNCANPRSDRSAIEEDAGALRREIFSPILPLLATKPVVVVVETDDVLAAIPLTMIFPGNNVVRSFSPGEFSERATRGVFPAKPHSLLVANPEPDQPLRDAFPALREAEREGEDFALRFPGTKVLSGRGATPDALKKEGPAAQIFHFSGHATLSAGSGALVLSNEAGTPAFSGILAADAVATQDWLRCQLVVLSACSTGNESPAPAQPDNLAHAFLAAGARRVVATLWDVDAAATRDLMREFYDGIVGGAQPGAAMESARRAIRGRTGREHPYFWAGFQVFGTY